MKDMPALLCAALSTRDGRLHEAVFDKVIDDTKMLRTYVQMLRSGAVGRKSLGSGPKRLVQRWLEAREEDALFRSSVGADPSLADVLKMTHPKPNTPVREAFYGYLLGRDNNADVLPATVKAYEQFKAGQEAKLPDLPFTMLSSLPLTAAHWASIAENASWQTTRMNLNTFARHGVFKKSGMAKRIASRLSDPQEIRRARVLPYQLMTAFVNCSAEVPEIVRWALQDAMETAISSVPSIEGRVLIAPDVSGSMQSPVTGRRKGATTKVRCIDVAALIAAAFVRKNHNASVMPFEQAVVKINLNPSRYRDDQRGQACRDWRRGNQLQCPAYRVEQAWRSGRSGHPRFGQRIVGGRAGRTVEPRSFASGRGSGKGTGMRSSFASIFSLTARRRRRSAPTS
jgi:60 kDa SS-A/Ro ribonucleoprotein